MSAFFVFGFGVLAYFLPGILAELNWHRNRNAIGMVNLLLGWTLLGWLIAFFWAFTNDPEREAPAPPPLRRVLPILLLAVAAGMIGLFVQLSTPPNPVATGAPYSPPASRAAPQKPAK